MLLVAATNAGSVVVDLAAVVGCEVLAAVGDVDVPITILNEYADALVGQVPADIVKITPGIRCFDGQGYISATQAGAFFTKIFAQNQTILSMSHRFKLLKRPYYNPWHIGSSMACSGQFSRGGPALTEPSREARIGE